MSTTELGAPPSKDRIKGDRLRKIRDTVNSIGKRNLSDVFKLGAAFEEASGLLKGSFGAWVLHECKIEPRTVLGYRKVSRHLSEHRAFLIDQELTPSAAITLASASANGRQVALDALRSGRRLNAQDMKLLVGAKEGGSQNDLIGAAAFRKAANAHAAAVTLRLNRLTAEISSALDAGAPPLVDVAKNARTLSLQLVAMTTGSAPSARDGLQSLSDAIEAFAKARKPEPLRETARSLLEVVGGFGRVNQPPEVKVISPKTSDTQTPSQRRRSITSVSSPFKHGLTSFEVCAGGGGQACGLSQAGFRHVGMIEREPDACETLRANFGSDHVIEANLVGYEPGDVGPIDLFAGGVPCQSFSKASAKRKGHKDRRDLFPEALRLIKQMSPRAIMLENVEGLFDPDYDMYRHRILQKLAAMGYRCEWRKVYCSHFGIPQTRVRTILVGFLDPSAMARFCWPEPVAHYEDEPYPVIGAVDTWLRARGYNPPPEVSEAFNCVAPTVLGGSSRKQSPDFGKRKTASKWEAMTLITTRWGEHSPEPDHSGPILPANGLIAAIQGFPGDWRFSGEKHPVFRQIGNAFPPIVALHLGCAVATALTGEYHAPQQALSLQGARFRLPPMQTVNSVETPREQKGSSLPLQPRVRDLLLRDLQSLSSLATRETANEFPHEIAYAPYEWNADAEAEHYVAYWQDPNAGLRASTAS